MESIRKPYQGIWNIILFNWHLYALGISFLLISWGASLFLPKTFSFLVAVLSLLTLSGLIVSLAVSWYLYDKSGLYKMKWINTDRKYQNVVNIHSGFDETTDIIKSILPHANLIVLDFYDPVKHTEISIKRARRLYPPDTDSIAVSSEKLPLQDEYADAIFIVFAAHEIRKAKERIKFFQEVKRILKSNGVVYVTEHPRNLANFIAYNIGAFHFFPPSAWHNTFTSAGFSVHKTYNHSIFIKTFQLLKNGISG